MQGQAEAQYRLKMIYGYGQVVEQDYAIAIELFTSVANQGYRDALYKLARIFIFTANSLHIETSRSCRVLR